MSAIEDPPGEWVWVPADQNPVNDVPVGMSAMEITTRCRWTHRHIAEEMPIPQPCCYSVLITTSRLPGPVQQKRHWLAHN